MNRILVLSLALLVSTGAWARGGGGGGGHSSGHASEGGHGESEGGHFSESEGGHSYSGGHAEEEVPTYSRPGGFFYTHVYHSTSVVDANGITRTVEVSDGEEPSLAAVLMIVLAVVGVIIFLAWITVELD